MTNDVIFTFPENFKSFLSFCTLRGKIICDYAVSPRSMILSGVEISLEKKKKVNKLGFVLGHCKVKGGWGEEKKERKRKYMKYKARQTRNAFVFMTNR